MRSLLSNQAAAQLNQRPAAAQGRGPEPTRRARHRRRPHRDSSRPAVQRPPPRRTPVPARRRSPPWSGRCRHRNGMNRGILRFCPRRPEVRAPMPDRFGGRNIGAEHRLRTWGSVAKTPGLPVRSSPCRWLKYVCISSGSTRASSSCWPPGRSSWPRPRRTRPTANPRGTATRCRPADRSWRPLKGCRPISSPGCTRHSMAGPKRPTPGTGVLVLTA